MSGLKYCCSDLSQSDPGVMDASDPAHRTLFGADKHSSTSQKEVKFTPKHSSFKFAPNMGSGAWNGGRVLAEQKGMRDPKAEHQGDIQHDLLSPRKRLSVRIEFKSLMLSEEVSFLTVGWFFLSFFNLSLLSSPFFRILIL